MQNLYEKIKGCFIENTLVNITQLFFERLHQIIPKPEAYVHYISSTPIIF